MTTEPVERRIAGRYDLHQKLGEGGMGSVWLAWDIRLDRYVALKELRFEHGMTGRQREEARRRVEREARAAARHLHHNIVTIYDVLEDDGDPWISMEYVEGTSLLTWPHGTASERSVAEIGLGVLDALEVVHAAGVVHRDIKPANIVVRRGGRSAPLRWRTCLVDFGAAVIRGHEPITRYGFVGTLGYMAPERFGGYGGSRSAETGTPSDLWSLGVTMYQVIEGRLPFARETDLAVVKAITEDPFDPMDRADLLGDVIASLLVKEPTARPSASEVRRRLESILAPPRRDVPRPPVVAPPKNPPTVVDPPPARREGAPRVTPPPPREPAHGPSLGPPVGIGDPPRGPAVGLGDPARGPSVGVGDPARGSSGGSPVGVGEPGGSSGGSSVGVGEPARGASVGSSVDLGEPAESFAEMAVRTPGAAAAVLETAGPRGAAQFLESLRSLPDALVSVVAALRPSFAATALGHVEPDAAADVLLRASEALTHELVALLGPAVLPAVLAALPPRPPRTAWILGLLSDAEAGRVFNGIPTDRAVPLLAALDQDRMATILARMNPRRAADVLTVAPAQPSAAAQLLGRLPSRQATGVLEHLDPLRAARLLMADPLRAADRLNALSPATRTEIFRHMKGRVG